MQNKFAHDTSDQSKRTKCVYFGALDEDVKGSIAVSCSIVRLSHDEMRLY